MNPQDGIITPDIANLIAKRVIAAAHAPTPSGCHWSVAERLLTEIRTVLKDEIAASYDDCKHWFDRDIREVVTRLQAISAPPSLPPVTRAATPELTRDIVAYCAKAPRTLMQLRRRIRLYARADHQDISEMVRAWERDGVIRNSGTASRHQWVPSSPTPLRLTPIRLVDTANS